MQEGVSAVQKFQRRIFSNTDTLQDRNQMWLQYHDNKILLSHLCLDPYISSQNTKNIKIPSSFGSILDLHVYDICLTQIMLKHQTDIISMAADFLSILF